MKLIKNKIDSNQKKIIKTISDIEQKIVFIKSTPFTSKTTILKELFDKSHCSAKIFVTGCNPNYINEINELILEQIKSILNKCDKNDVIICLDEYYDEKLINYFDSIILKNRIRVFVTINNVKISKVQNYQVIDIYDRVFDGISDILLESYRIDLNDSIKNRKMSLKEIKLVMKYKKDYLLEKNKLDIIKKMQMEYKKRDEPSITSLLYINNKIAMLTNYDCSKLRS